MPDGRPIEIVVETAGEDTEQTDILELIGDNWAKIGVKLFAKPSQRDIVRNRIFSGEAMMSVWTGLENGLAMPRPFPMNWRRRHSTVGNGRNGASGMKPGARQVSR